MTLDSWAGGANQRPAPLILTQEIGPRMSPGGSIVNIASKDANVGSFRSIAYSTSKASLLSVTRSPINVLGVSRSEGHRCYPGPGLNPKSCPNLTKRPPSHP